MVDRVELEASVPEEMHGARLDQAAAQVFSQYSRSRLQTWIKQGELTLDGRQCQPRDKVSAGASLVISAALSPEVGWKAQDLPLDIVFEDDSILVLNKPAGLVVHPAAGHSRGTLVNALLGRFPELDTLPRAGIVHRLDKDTSGVMVVARDLESHSHLVSQLQARTVSRKYTAVCIGALTGGGMVDAPIGRHPRQRKKMAVLPHGGKPAITHYRIARRFAHHTQIDVSLETGRTHQIRVHMAHRHNPLVGDPLYGGRPRIPKGASQQLAEALRTFPRQALHARELGLLHPKSGENLVFQCSLPDDLVALIDILKAQDQVVS